MTKTKRHIFLCVLVSILPWQIWAQFAVHFNAQNLVLNENERTIVGELAIEITFSENVDTLQMLFWPNAYKNNATQLARELRENQSVKFEFAEGIDRGYLSLQALNSEDEWSTWIDQKCFRFPESFEIPIQAKAGQKLAWRFLMTLKLPAAEFNGFGVAENSINLSHWLPEFVPNQTQPAHNSVERLRKNYPATYDLRLRTAQNFSAVSSLSNAVQNGTTFQFTSENATNDPLIILYKDAKNYTPNGNVNPSVVIFNGHFPPFNETISWQKISTFFQREWGWELPQKMQLALLQKNGLKSCGSLLLIEPKMAQDELEGEIVFELAYLLAVEKLGIDAAAHPWLTVGMAHYYKHLFFEQNYPDKKMLGPLANTLFARIFDVDHYPTQQQNRMLFLYMARQGLDQPLGDAAEDFSRANFEAVVKGKSTLYFAYARSFVGEKNYLRSMHRWLQENDQNAQPEDWERQLQYFSNRPTEWLLGDILHTQKTLDYKLKRTENCSTVYTATVKNKGGLTTPFPIAGKKNGEPVLVEWIDGFECKKTKQIHLEEYDEVSIDPMNVMPEVNQKNNDRKTHGLFKPLKPLKLQFYTSFENREKTQIFWLPSLKYNAYDKLLIGAQFYNTNIFTKPFEYRIAPDFSTGTGQITGLASFKFNINPKAEFLRQVSFGVYARYYHYAEDLAYLRLSPTLTFKFAKSHPRSPWIRTLRFRSVSVDREQPGPGQDIINNGESPNYQIFDVRYQAEKGTLRSPFIGIVDAQFGDNFWKLSGSIKQRYLLTRNHLITARVFAGVMSQANPYFQFGLSGTTDYLFDYYFIGRSDQNGLWSQQMFVNDGGFKSQTDIFASDVMLAANLNLPIYRFVGLFGDVAFVDDDSQIFWDYGLYLELIPDFFEVYFPLQSNEKNIYSAPDYSQNIRFVLNVQIDQIVNRVRRGWY